MAYESKTGLNVNNQYGARSTGTSVGTDWSKNSAHELTIEFSGNSLQDRFMPPFVLPKGARITRAELNVLEAFTLTGTTPTVIFGGTAPATNGITLSAATLGSVATTDQSAALTGTWATNSAAGTTASEKVTNTLGGTTPAVTAGVGKASLVIRYVYKNRELGSFN